MLTSAAAALRLRAGPRATAGAAVAAGTRLAAGTALATALAASTATSSTGSTQGSSGEEPRDQAGSLARGPRVAVQPPQPPQALADPAESPSGVMERIAEMAQNVLRPREARPHAYHYAEDSARAVMAEQLESGRGQPTVEAMYAPPEVAGSDAITAPRAWHFSNRSDQLDERQQEKVAAQNPGVE